MKQINWKKKKIALLGFGSENQAVLEYLIKQGAKDIIVRDENPKSKLQISNKIQNPNIKFQTGRNYLKNLKQFDIIFRTPGIPYLTKEIQQAEKAGSIITSQTKLFFDLCPAKIIGITGTKGKGTTTALISAILKNKKTKKQKNNIWTGGNIGNAPIEFVDKVKKDDWVVLELSSFQLQDLEKSPHIAVVLDIRQDHLDHHKSINEYIESKTNIVKHQNKDDFTVINLDYMRSFAFALMSPTENDYYFSRTKSVDLGSFIAWDKNHKNGKIILRTEENEFELCKVSDIKLIGEHNLENICAAITASFLAGASIKSIEQEVIKYKGLEHRLEFVNKHNGVEYYNDSISTTPETAIAAIKSFSKPIILIVGGSDKGANYKELGKEIDKGSVKVVIAIGKTGPKIISECRMQNAECKIIKDLKNMKQIVNTAAMESRSGDIVLLSPASASFDMFKNYKDRGEQFKSAVTDLKISSFK